ncbi:MAG: T9SS type A sorting domain-containing protein [Candidatus Neomarinimicrobiota bacterium]
MKINWTIITIVLALISGTGTLSGQESNPQAVAIEGFTVQTPESTPLIGSHYLEAKFDMVREYLSDHPEIRGLKKSLADITEFELGDTKEWWVFDWTKDSDLPESMSQIPTTCRAKGENCYVFVHDEIWAGGSDDELVTQAAVDAIVNGFDSETPNNVSQGIFEIDVETFGDPPDYDGDPRIIILIYDIIDGWLPGEGYIAGYFDPADQFPSGTWSFSDEFNTPIPSNEAEVFYMDARPADLLSDNGITGVLGTVAHEFQHMIHFAQDPNEGSFVNEGCSEIAAFICGYGFRDDDRYAVDPNIYLYGWNSTLADYTRAALYAMYLYEQFGKDFFKVLVASPGVLKFGLDAAMADFGSPRNSTTVFIDWIIANYLNDKSYNEVYGYDYSPLPKPIPSATNYAAASGIGAVKRLGVEYITFKQGSIESVIFEGSTFKVKAIKSGSALVEDVAVGSDYPTPGLMDGTWDEITFAVYNESFYPEFLIESDYSYVGSGGAGGAVTVEQVFDDGSGDGTLNLTPGDSISVQFNGLAGAKLDSIKIAFRNAGSMQMGVWRFTGSYGTSPLGAPLVPERTVTSNSASASPFPDPFENWVTVDLSGEDIDASEDFIVSLLVGADPAVPGVMASSEPDIGVYRSRTWYQAAGGGWYILTANAGANTWNYLIRAYLCASGCTIEVGPENIGMVPAAYSLSENFPNPFNPSTTFTYNITESGEVNFAIYDLIGRLIYEEQRTHIPGQYSLRWNGVDSFDRKVGSGVYILRMQTNEFSATRKMVLLK